MPEVARQFWREVARQTRPILASSRRLPRAIRRLPVVPVWQPPLARPRYVRASSRRHSFDGLRSPLGGIRSPFGNQNAWRPTRLFANNEVGGWWDPSDLSSMFQDSAGTTPVTAVEQPVGLHLDKSKGLALGAELVVNGGFDTNTTGWTVVGTATFNSVGGQGVLTVTSGSFFAGQSLATTSGKWYEVRGRFVSKSGGSTAFFRAGTSAIGGSEYFTTNPTVDGTDYVYRVLATGSTLYIAVGVNASGYSSTWDNISVREISGNHRYQGTSAARPTLSARYNLAVKTEQFDDATYTKSSLSVTADATTAPDGTATADKLVEAAATAQHYIYQTPTLTTGVTYKFSVRLKAAERSWAVLSLGGTFAANEVWFNLSSGVVGTVSGTVVASSIAADTNGFYICSVTCTATSTGPAPIYVKVANADNSNSYAGDGTSGIYVWGYDLRVSNDGVGLPAYQRVNTSTDYDTVGFPMYLKYDGVDDFMQTASVDFSGTDAMSVFSGVRKLSDATVSMIIELSATISANNGAFLIYNDTGVKWGVGSKGTIQREANPISGYSAPVTSLVGLLSDISLDQVILRLDGTQANQASGDQGTGNYGNYALYFGARAGTSLFFNGREYQTIIRGAASSAAEIAAAEAFVNNKTKAA